MRLQADAESTVHLVITLSFSLEDAATREEGIELLWHCAVYTQHLGSLKSSCLGELVVRRLAGTELVLGQEIHHRGEENSTDGVGGLGAGPVKVI
jgi:hypothetical protein